MVQSRRLHDEDEGLDIGGAEVVKLQPYKQIPLMDFPVSEEANNLYWKWCQTLFKRGLLTEMSREVVQTLALSQHDIGRCLAKGASTRYPMGDRAAALKKLSRICDDSPLSSPSSSDNPYASFGFAGRARHRRHD